MDQFGGGRRPHPGGRGCARVGVTLALLAALVQPLQAQSVIPGTNANGGTTSSNPTSNTTGSTPTASTGGTTTGAGGTISTPTPRRPAHGRRDPTTTTSTYGGSSGSRTGLAIGAGVAAGALAVGIISGLSRGGTGEAYSGGNSTPLSSGPKHVREEDQLPPLHRIQHKPRHPRRPPPPRQDAQLTPPSPPTLIVPPRDETRFVPDEVLLIFRPGTTPMQIRRFEARFGLRNLGAARIGLLDAQVSRYGLRPGAVAAQTLRGFSASQIVAFAQPNYLFALQVEPTAAPATPGPAKPPLADPGPPSQYAVDVLRVPDAHKLATGSDVRVAVIDSGIDETNPDLSGTVVDRFDAVGGAFKPHSHGTAIGGAIVAHRKLVGIAPKARLIAVRAFSGSSAGSNGMGFDILRGLDFAATHKARVVNMSFAGPEDRLLDDAITAARLRGIVIVAAAGNGGPKAKPMFPAAAPGTLAVTASDPDNKPFALANRGTYIAVAAPGVNIIAPGLGDTVQMTSGTSIATAEASGVIALLLERKPNLKPDEIRKILAATAQKSSGEADALGAGVLDAHAAVAGHN